MLPKGYGDYWVDRPHWSFTTELDTAHRGGLFTQTAPVPGNTKDRSSLNELFGLSSFYPSVMPKFLRLNSARTKSRKQPREYVAHNVQFPEDPGPDACLYKICTKHKSLSHSRVFSRL